MKIEQLEKRIGYAFRDPDLLQKALTHSSYAYESPDRVSGDNELLEFLGDSIIGLAASEFFFTAYPDRTEGELSKLKASVTNTAALAAMARKIKLDKALRLGKGEEKSGGRKKPSILAGAFEAVAGAVYLDGGFEPARDFFQRLLAGSFKKVPANDFLVNNYKSALQEAFQKDGLPPPVYATVSERGPDHRKTFIIEVCQGDRVLARARGGTKKSAEQRAAQKALRKILGRRMKSLTEDDFILKGGA